MASNRTFTMIKPEAMAAGHAGKILDMIISNGFRLVALKYTRLSHEEAGVFYAVHKERPFYGELVDYLASGPIIAAILGDNINYWVGRFFGAHITAWKLFGRPLVRPKDLEKTHGYFDKYGVRTIIIARFVPIVRTITPFVAGIGKMDYRRKFLPFDIMGGMLWITILLMAGFVFGQHPFVQKNYEVVILGIVFISVLPMIVEFARIRLSPKKAAQ